MAGISNVCHLHGHRVYKLLDRPETWKVDVRTINGGSKLARCRELLECSPCFIDVALGVADLVHDHVCVRSWPCERVTDRKGEIVASSWRHSRYHAHKIEFSANPGTGYDYLTDLSRRVNCVSVGIAANN